MKIRLLIAALLTIAVLGHGQNVDCLDSPDKLTLFKGQIKYNAKPIVMKGDENFLPDSIYLKVDLSKSVTYDYLIKGIQVYIINTSSGELTFSDDVILDLICQAKNGKGEWIEIENRKMPWNCNGQTMTLNRNSYFKAIVPCYKGTVKTAMRYRFQVSNRTFFSDEFEGMLNPGQLQTTVR